MRGVVTGIAKYPVPPQVPGRSQAPPAAVAAPVLSSFLPVLHTFPPLVFKKAFSSYFIERHGPYSLLFLESRAG